MKENVSQKLLEIQEQALKDETYYRLMAEHTQRNALFLEVMSQLDEKQQNAIYDYFGVVLEMQQRLMMIAMEKNSNEK